MPRPPGANMVLMIDQTGELDQKTGGGSRPPPGSVSTGPLAAGALAPLYLDALGLPDRRGTLYPHLQHAVLEAGVDLALVNTLRQRHAPLEGSIPTLPDVVARAFPLLLSPALPGDREHTVLQRDVHILLLDTRKLGPDHYVPILLEHVERRSPLRSQQALLLLLVPTTTGEVPENLVEHPVHLTLHVIEATEWTQRHLTHLLFYLAASPTARPPLLPGIHSIPPIYNFQTVFRQFFVFLHLLV